MRSLSIILLSLLIITGCKKKEAEVKPIQVVAKDFELIPVRDAVWKIHCTGWKNESDVEGPIDEIPNRVDSAVHTDFTITATGETMINNGHMYYKYNTDFIYSYSLPFPSTLELPLHYTNNIYLREDSAAKLLISDAEDIVINLSDEEPGRKFGGHPQMEIKYVDSLMVAGMYIKRWQACNSYDKNIEVLYKAYGIGTLAGPLPAWVIPNGAKVKHIDFTYKGSTLHLDFPNY